MKSLQDLSEEGKRTNHDEEKETTEVKKLHHYTNLHHSIFINSLPNTTQHHILINPLPKIELKTKNTNPCRCWCRCRCWRP